MLLFRMLWIISSIASVKLSIYQMRFRNTSETICVYLYDSMVSSRIDTLEVKLNIALELFVCPLNNTSEKIDPHPFNDTEEVLIIQLSDHCSLVQQLNALKNTSWIQDYFALIFAVNHRSQIFEHTLLSYLYSQINSPLQLNDTIIGFIDSTEVHRLNNLPSNPFLHRLQRENSLFDPSIVLTVSIAFIGMLIGNEWHRKIFLQKILDHSHSASTMNAKYGLIIGLLLFICFTLVYLIDRYLTFIIEEIYLVSFIIISTFAIYLCLERFCYLFIDKCYKEKNSDLNPIHHWLRLMIMSISFLMIVFWFLNRLTYVGLILTNLIVFCLSVAIVAQMRILNLMICLIIFGFIWLFECLAFLSKIYWDLKWKDTDERKLIVIHPEFPISIWTANEESNEIHRMYLNMLDNSGSDCWLSGGSLNLLKINAMKWIMKENLPLVLSFPRFFSDNDNCAFHAGRIYFSIDDLIFPSLLINFCRLFDIGNEIRFRIYYIQALISYLLSVFLSYILILITKHDQLSSIIIYPIIMISTMSTGLIRGEFRKLLRGTLTTLEERQKKEREDSF